MNMNCFRVRFRIVHGKFQRLDNILKGFLGSYDKQELEALRSDIQVLGSQNIREIEIRIDALSASLTRQR